MEFNWAPEANLHVTLNFLGETDVARLAELCGVIQDVASSAAPFETSLKGFGGFPDERHMRVLWVGVRLSRALAELQSRMREELLGRDFPQEDRDYVPHLTIGRTRKARAGTDLISPYVRTSFGDIDVGDITLYESLMQGSHPVYKPVEKFVLTGAPVEALE